MVFKEGAGQENWERDGLSYVLSWMSTMNEIMPDACISPDLSSLMKCLINIKAAVVSYYIPICFHGCPPKRGGFTNLYTNAYISIRLWLDARYRTTNVKSFVVCASYIGS
jgi:hypothetical protein